MGIRDRIINSPELQAARAARDLDALAAGLNAQGALEVRSRYVTTRTIMDECGTLDDGRAIIAALKAAASADPLAGEALLFLQDDSGFDIGKPKTRDYLDAMVPDALSAERVQMLKDMALQPVVVTRDQVNDAMFNPDGSEK